LDMTYSLGISLMGALLIISLIIVCYAMNNPIEQSKKVLWLFVSMVLYIPVAGYICLIDITATLHILIDEPANSITLSVIGYGILYPMLFLILPALAIREARKTMQEK
jgi:hypothetical protein